MHLQAINEKVNTVQSVTFSQYISEHFIFLIFNYDLINLDSKL